jgi:glycosyltransferase involved in cell wall biosynthesis
MRIVHLSTGHQGGAGLAARRLSGGLQAAGVDSRFVALENRAYKPKENEFQVKRDFRQRLEAGISTYIAKKFTDKTLVTPVSTNVIDRKFLREMTTNEDTIFHIHNWFNLFSQKKLFELSREFNFVLTLHDQRAFTAACHYSLGCEKFKSKCTKCPQIAKKFDQLLMSSNQEQVSGLNFVTPSHWLLELANSSNLFKECSGEVIPNSFFGYEASVTPVSKLRRKIRIGFAAMDSNSWIKGGDLVSALKMKYSDGTKYEFLALADFKDYREFWNSIDLLLVPSRADNSPNVIHEAKLWGIPVISSNVGGIPEILSPGFDKCIPIEDLSVVAIESEIEQVLNSSLSTDLRLEVAKTHMQYLDKSITKHLKLYEKILRKKSLDRGK